MIYLLFYMLGFGGCFILWGLRELERRGVFKALTAEIERLRKRDQRARHVIGNIYADCVTFNQKFNLGGRALLPASAKPIGQRLAHPITRVTTGLPDGSSDFSKGKQ